MANLIKVAMLLSLWQILGTCAEDKKNPDVTNTPHIFEERFLAIEGVMERQAVMIEVLMYKMNTMTDKMNSVTDKMNTVTDKMNTVTDEMNTVTDEMEMMTNKMEMMADKIAFMETSLSQKKTTNPNTQYIKSLFGCVSETITLSCPSNQTISIIQANYGEYSQVCDVTCCSPHPYDCTELMSEADVSSWVELLLLCDNQTACSYLFQGTTFLNQCTPTDYVDYLDVFYRCLPESIDGQVAFSAYASVSAHYEQNDIMLFDAVLTNLGECYQPHTSIFICPFHGVFFFHINVLTTDGNKHIVPRIQIEGIIIAGGFAENVQDRRYSASASAIKECDTGERVWVRSDGGNSAMTGSNQKPSSFVGHVLYRY